MFTIVKTSAALVFAAAAIVIAAAPAAAEAVSVRVGYADLNLAAPAGVAMIDHRIDRAARHVCGSGGETLQTRSASRRCYADAARNGNEQVARAVADAKRRSAVVVASR